VIVVIPVTVMMVISIVAIAIIAMVVAVPVAIPAVIVFDTTMLPTPIPFVELSAIIPRTYPASSLIGRPGPIAIVPAVTVSCGIPVTIHPNVISARTDRTCVYYARAWWRTDSDSEGNLGGSQRKRPEHHRGKRCYAQKSLHVFNSP
jgi:hypothetical protein